MTEETWAQTMERVKTLTRSQAAAEVSDAVYQATKLFEALERNGQIAGNAHHIRQVIAKFAADMVVERWGK